MNLVPCLWEQTIFLLIPFSKYVDGLKTQSTDGILTRADSSVHCATDFFNTLRTRSFKLFKRPFPGFLTILTL